MGMLGRAFPGDKEFRLRHQHFSCNFQSNNQIIPKIFVENNPKKQYSQFFHLNHPLRVETKYLASLLQLQCWMIAKFSSPIKQYPDME
jgi:hypothetical protein